MTTNLPNENNNINQDEICDNCHETVTDYYKYSCNHKVCTLCLYRRIFCNYLKDFKNDNEIITIKCQKDNIGTLGKDFNEIETLLEKKLNIDIERENSKRNKMFSTSTPFCKIHKSKYINQYCLNCSLSICQECVKLHLEKNPEHIVVPSSRLAKRYKRSIKELPLKIPNKDLFDKKFDVMTSKIQQSLQKDYNDTLKQINEIANSLYLFKKNYEESYTKELTRCVKSLKLIKVFYLNYYYDKDLCKDSIEVNLLRFVNNISLEFMDLNISHDKSINSNLGEIKSIIESMSQANRQNVINIDYNFDEVPRSFKCEDIILKAHSEYIKSILETPDQKLITGSSDYSIKIWEEDDDTFHIKNTINQLCGKIQCLLLLNDGRILSSSSTDNNIKVWLYKNGNFELRQSLTAHNKIVTSMAQLNDLRLVTSSVDFTIKIWKENNSNEFIVQYTINNDNKPILKVIGLSFNRIAYHFNEEIINVFGEKNEEFKFITYLKRHTGKVISLCQIDLNNNYYLVSGGSDHLIIIWKPKESISFEYCQTLNRHLSDILSIIQLKDGRLASASRDRTIRIWKYYESKSVFEEDEVLSDYGHAMMLLIQLNDKRLCSVSSDHAIVIWRNRIEEY